MNLDIFFNWPPGENSARIDLGIPNVDDSNKEYRVGVMPKGQANMIAWHNAGWIHGEDVHNQFQGRVDRGDKVVVEQRLTGEDEEVAARLIVDTERDWPAEAEGPTQANVGWIM